MLYQNNNAWLRKSEDEKLRLFRNFILGEKRTRKRKSGCFLQIKNTQHPGLQKKPCQRKHVKSERTR